MANLDSGKPVNENGYFRVGSNTETFVSVVVPRLVAEHRWAPEGDVPGDNTIGAVSSDGRTTVVESVNPNVGDPVLAAECALVDHAISQH